MRRERATPATVILSDKYAVKVDKYTVNVDKYTVNVDKGTAGVALSSTKPL